MPDIAMENEKKKKEDKQDYWDKFLGFCKEYGRFILVMTILSITLYMALPQLLKLSIIEKVFAFLSKARLNTFTKCVFATALFASVVNIFYRTHENKTPTKRSLILSSTILINYILFIRNDIAVVIKPSNIIGIFTYTDFFIVSSSIGMIMFKKLKHITDNQTINVGIRLQEDVPSEEDLINRNSTVNGINDGSITTLAKTIIGNSPQKSFSIAVTGEWGSGKTTYLNMLKKELEDRKGDIDLVIIRFQPWEWVGDTGIFEAFFEELSKELHDHNDRLIRDIKSYTQLILGKGQETGLTEKLLQLLGVQPTPKTISACREVINTTITNYNKKIVVMIDDIDRLNSDEIIQTLKLIRSVADFKNTYFITALDYNHVIHSIKGGKQIEQPEEYLNKFFQQHIPLPSNKKDSIKSIIKYTICQSIDLSPNELESLDAILEVDGYTSAENSLGSQSALLSKTIKNLRCLKIFANNFAITYNLVRHECDIHSIFYLELLKLHNVKLYMKLLNTDDILTYKKTDNDRLYVNQSYFKLQDKEIVADENSKSILENIFPLSQHTLTNKSVAFAYNFWKYLYSQSFEEIPHAEIEKTFTLSTDKRIQIERGYYNSYRRISYERHIVEAVWKTENTEALSKHLIVALSIIRENNNHFASIVIDTLFSRISFPLNTQENISIIESICSDLLDTQTIHITTKTLLLSKQISVLNGTEYYYKKLNEKLIPRMLALVEETFTVYGNNYSVDVNEILSNFFTDSLLLHKYSNNYEQSLKESIRKYLIKTKETYAPYIIRHYARQNMGISFILDDLLLTVFDVLFKDEITQNEIDRFTEFINSIESNNELAAAPKKYLNKIVETINDGQKFFYLDNEADAERIKLLIHVRNTQPLEN